MRLTASETNNREAVEEREPLRLENDSTIRLLRAELVGEVLHGLNIGECTSLKAKVELRQSKDCGCEEEPSVEQALERQGQFWSTHDGGVAQDEAGRLVLRN